MAKKPGRRDNGDGTYVQRADGRHEYRIPIGGGKYRSASSKNRKEAKRKSVELRAEIERGVLSAGRQTVAQWLDTWLEGKATRIKEASLRRYTDVVRLHIKPHIGHVALKDLTADQVQKMENALLRAKPKGRTTRYSTTTVKMTHVVIQAALKDAHRMRLVSDNVAAWVDAPRVRHTEMQYWTPEEARAFLAFVRGREHRLEALLILSLATGMRQGEALGLQWTDIDWEKHTLTVVRTVRYVVGGTFQFTAPKTRRSMRTIKLNGPTLAALKAHRARQATEQLAAGPAWANEHNLVFTTVLGTPVASQNLDKYFRRLVRDAGVPSIRWHDMRHTCATILLSHDANVKAVSELLGHANIAITLQTYAHLLPSMTDQMATIMEEALFVG